MPDHAHRRGTRGAQPSLEVHGRLSDGPDTDDLLVAAGHGDLSALAAFYDATAPVVFGLLHTVLGDRVRAERATERVYLHLWRTAAAFEPAEGSACSLLLRATHREMIGRVQHLLGNGQTKARGSDHGEPAHLDGH